MLIKRVCLKSFRNLSQMALDLSPGINIFYGDNAQGKTNFLEAVYICSTGRSQRAHAEREMIAYSDLSAHIQVFVKNLNAEHKIEIHLKRGDKKGIAIDGLPIKKLSQLFGNLLTVIFSPEDLQLVKAGPAERRRFMDIELCQLSAVYYHDLQQYYHVLKQRNNLLKSIKSSPALKDTLVIWDEQLVKHGIKMIDYRTRFVENMSVLANQAHSRLTNDTESLKLLYKPNTLPEQFLQKLTKNIERDIALGSTSVGVHKDDITFLLNDSDARIYGSQGQQRTVALAAKLAEIQLIRDSRQLEPVLLLDDVLSELDENRQLYLLKSLNGIQTIMTCTSADDILKKLNKFKIETPAVYRVTAGDIVEAF